ncbi:MAG: acyl carrier protein [Pseudomonadota bacterium]|nr:acyl carrier protein [Pseudomonadota bacterium]
MRGRAVAVALSVVAYVVACHWLMTRAPEWRWNGAVIVGPMLLLLSVHLWQRRQRVLATLCAVGLAALLAQAWRGGGIAPRLLYLLQHAGVHAGLAVLFVMTLRPGQEPLITALARRVHRGLTPAMEAYSRRVTIAWAVYFAAMAGVSVCLFVAAPFEIWATFANFATPLVIAALFVAEHTLRYRLHPEFERATLSAAMSAYAHRNGAP